MNNFEGYIGIQAGDNQLVNDMMFAILSCLLILFALAFRTHFQLFVKMMKDVVQIKQRQSLFEMPMNNAKGNEWIFRSFMTFQALLLCTVCFLEMGRGKGVFYFHNIYHLLSTTSLIFIIILVFYFLKQGFYYLVGCVFVEKEQYTLWKSSYHAVIGTWGTLLYIPSIWLVFVDASSSFPLFLFVFLYFLCRFVIFYKTLRIFQIKKDIFLYLILYLCAQEIIPLFLLYRGVTFLYNIIEMSTLWR